MTSKGTAILAIAARGGFPAPKFLRSIEESPQIAPHLKPPRARSLR